MEGLKKYKKRNLKIKETTRCRIFIDLIESAVKNNFNKEQTEVAASDTLNKLNKAKLGPEGNIETLEIIPFERLWKWIADRLD